MLLQAHIFYLTLGLLSLEHAVQCLIMIIIYNVET